MRTSGRAAALAALTSCVVASGFASSPSFALDLPADRSAIATPRLAYPTTVPIPPTPIVPAEWTSEEPGGTPSVPIRASAAPDADYASLDHAVDAQSVGSDVDRELKCLATGIYYEAKGEPLAGQLAVAEVILNRSRSKRYPASVCGVLTQRGQFSFVRGGRLPTVPTTRGAWKTAVAVARVARDALWESKASDAMFFHARHVSPRWKRARVAALGNHIFYR